MMLGPKTT